MQYVTLPICIQLFSNVYSITMAYTKTSCLCSEKRSFDMSREGKKKWMEVGRSVTVDRTGFAIAVRSSRYTSLCKTVFFILTIMTSLYYGSLSNTDFDNMESQKVSLLPPKQQQQQRKEEDVYPEANREQAQLLCLMDETIQDARRLPLEVPAPASTRPSIPSLGYVVWIQFLAMMLGTSLLSILPTLGTTTIPTSLLVLLVVLLFVWPLSWYAKKHAQSLAQTSFTPTNRRLVHQATDTLLIHISGRIDSVYLPLVLTVNVLKEQWRAIDQKKISNIDPLLLPTAPKFPSIEDLQRGKEELRSSIRELQDSIQDKDLLVVPEKTRLWTLQLVYFLLLVVTAFGAPILLGLLKAPVWMEGIHLSSHITITADCLMAMTYTIPTFFMATALSTVIHWSTHAKQTLHLQKHQQRLQEITLALLQQYGIAFLTLDILELRMQHVRKQLLDWIHFSHKLEMMQSILADDDDGRASPVASDSSSPVPVSPNVKSPWSFGSWKKRGMEGRILFPEN